MKKEFILFCLFFGIKDLIIWGFDMKYDPDVWTWLWVASGAFWFAIAIYNIIKK